MSNINLLPWRDEERQEKKKEFFTILIGFCILGLVCGYTWVSSVQGSIDNQSSRNQLLQSEIAKLEDQVKEIEELKKRKAELLDRMKVIQDLQYTRPVIVHYFDEIVKAVPKGIYLTELSRKGDQLSIVGAAESLNRISSLMRNFEESEWFEGASMSTIDELSDKDSGIQEQKFKMTVNAAVPAKKDDIANKGNG
ncbi:MAG: PilN domain-containing protein [Cellvibrionaceae bacterium]